jgi:hypothetical protein
VAGHGEVSSTRIGDKSRAEKQGHKESQIEHQGQAAHPAAGGNGRCGQEAEEERSRRR